MPFQYSATLIARKNHFLYNDHSPFFPWTIYNIHASPPLILDLKRLQSHRISSSRRFASGTSAFPNLDLSDNNESVHPSKIMSQDTFV